MIERIEGIVIDIVRHNDKHNVVTLFTRRYGRMAFLAPVSTTRAGRMRNASLSLMAVVSSEVNIRPGKELYGIRRVEPERLWHSIYANPVKTSLIFFLAEFFNRLVRQYPADVKLWLYLIGSLEWLDSVPTRNVANFHIAFLVGLLPIVGIEPSVSDWEEGDKFDMVKAEMVPEATGRNILSEEESRFLPLLMRMNFRNMHKFRLTQTERQRLLSRLLSYYSVHLPVNPDLKSLPVLRDLFS